MFNGRIFVGALSRVRGAVWAFLGVCEVAPWVKAGAAVVYQEEVVTGGGGSVSTPGGGPGTGTFVTNTNAIIRDPIARALGAGFVPCTVDIVISHTVPRVSNFGPSRQGLLCAVCGVKLLGNGAVGSTGVINEAVRLGPRNSTTVCRAVIELSRNGRTLLRPFMTSGNSFNGTCSHSVTCTTSHCARTGLTPVSTRLFTSVSGSAISFISGCSNSVGRPILFPMAFPAVLIGTGVNVTTNVTDSVYSFGLGRIYRAAVTCVGSSRVGITSALLTPSFSVNNRLLCGHDSVRGVCRANHKDFGMENICDCSGSRGYVSVARVPPAAADRRVVRGIIRLMGNGGVARVGSVHSRASLGNLGVAVSLGHNISISGLVGGVVGVAPFRSDFTYGFGVLVTNSPHIVNIGRVVDR